MAIEVFAPAKVNLTLHVSGQRPDGYHLLDSLVCFASVGDRLSLAPGGALRLDLAGPEAAGLEDGPDNLVMRAAAMFLAQGQGGALSLDKQLPVSSGIGGGSADAAATIRAILHHRKLPLGPAQREQALSLGADVPMCLECRPLRVGGIGERLEPVSIPPLHAVLANPRCPVSTPVVFRYLETRDNPPMPDRLPDFCEPGALLEFLGGMRNDLEAPARRVAPLIGTVLDALGGAAGCRLARMSGSGATCFGLFEQEAAAQVAAAQLRLRHPEWWVAKCVLGDFSEAATPRDRAAA